MNTQLTSEFEETSVVSKISYEVENVNTNDLPKNKLK
ncbi:hypothetical protein ACUXFT_001590 [Staphylococcus epidermidis]